MTATEKPTIIIVPGAWHKVVHVQPLIDVLERRGYRVLCTELATVQTDKPRPTWEQEVDHIKSSAQAELETGRDVLLLLHSYAGLPGCEAVNRLVQAGAHKREPSQGVFRRVVFLAAQHFPAGFVVDNHQFVGPQNPDFFIDKNEMSHHSKPFERFFNDCNTREEAQPYIDAIDPMYNIPGGGAIMSDDWKQAPHTIVGCTQDTSITPELIKQFWHGHEDEVQWIDCGHTPFFAKPELIADLLSEEAQKQ